jgi:hypothetical protein
VGPQAATVIGDTFSAAVPVNAGSNALDVVAWSPDGAPTLVNLVVYRGVTPETYLSTGGGDRGVQGLLARPIVAGTRVRLQGSLIADLSTPNEQPTWQLVVEHASCPSRRCTALVRAPASPALEMNANVEVIGELRGERAYTTQSGERRSDPIVQAVVVTRRRP